jgi:hypothetical protein
MKNVNSQVQKTQEKIKKAIIDLENRNEKISINKIAKLVNIDRRTMYNYPQLLEECRSAINNQKNTEEKDKTLTIEQIFMKAIIVLKSEKEKNSRLLKRIVNLREENFRLNSEIKHLKNLNKKHNTDG